MERVRHVPEAGRFEIDLGEAKALLTYRLEGQRMIITHTEVPPAFGGRGLGSRLAQAALEHARAQGYRVVPLCSFVAAYLERHPEYADLRDRS